MFVGFSMTFSPALWIVMVAIVVNLFSDLAGQYENGLYAPVSLRVVSNEDREAAMGFSQALKTTCQMVFNGIGAVLISFMYHSQLALVNAGTFALAAVIMLMLCPKLNKLLVANPIQTTHQSQEQVSFIKDFRASIKLVIEEMFKIPEIKMNMVIMPALNGLLGGLSLLVVLMMKTDKGFLVINPSVTLAAISISVLLGSILGNILAISALKKVKLISIIRLTTVLLILLYVSLLLHNAYLLLSVSFLLGLSSGAVNPKFNALIFNSLPEDKLALISNGISTYFMAGMAFFQLLMSGLVLVLSADQISWLLLLLSLGLVAYALGMKTSPQSRLSH
ncbi:MFS transporter [Streptococcus dentasini]